MSHEENLNRLENIVNNLLGKLDAVAEEKRRLAERLRQVGTEKAELEQELNRMRDEKEQVRSRVGGLIASIEQWERNFAGGEAGSEAIAAEEEEA